MKSVTFESIAISFFDFPIFSLQTRIAESFRSKIDLEINTLIDLLKFLYLIISAVSQYAYETSLAEEFLDLAPHLTLKHIC
jgi:hypothetical protein